MADLAVRSDVDKVAARLTDPAAPIDRLVNNAGFGIRTRLTAEDLEQHERAIDVMIRAVLLLSGAAGAGHEGARRGLDHQRVQHIRLHHHEQLLRHQGLGERSSPKGWPTSWPDPAYG